MNRITILLAAVAVAGITMLAVPASAVGPSRLACAAPVTGWTHGWSLLRWAARHGSDIATVIVTTDRCGQGLDLRFIRYLDIGNDGRPMPHGLRLWTYPVPVGCGLRRLSCSRSSQ